MHDTPQKHLFAKQVRAESHGCMRVQNPEQLARTILEHDQGWSGGRVVSAIQNAYDQHVALQHKIPVHVTYFTLRVNEDGSISTFGDLYGHDARMAAALFGTRDGFNAQADAGQLSSSQEAPRVKRPRGSGRRGSPLSGFLSN